MVRELHDAFCGIQLLVEEMMRFDWLDSVHGSFLHCLDTVTQMAGIASVL